ncbi:MAG: glycosyltransferase [Minisyncoccia bacterium]
MQAMTILYIANIRLPTEKAHGVQIMKMCEAFARAGAAVELVVPTRKTSIAEDPFDYYGVAKVFSITRLRVPDTVAYGQLAFLLHVGLFAIAARRYVRHSKANIIYSRDPALFFFGAFPNTIRAAWEVHTRPTERILRRMRRLPVAMVAISNGLKQFLVGHGIAPEHIMFAHDGVSLAEFTLSESRETIRRALALPQDKVLIAYVGKYRTMGESKGVEQIIEAVGRLHAARPNIGLLLVGLNADEMDDVRALCDRAGLAPDAAYLVGHVEHTKVPRYLKAADVLVMNYPNTPHYAHSMSPLKLFEYMASGVPMVSSDLPSIREMLSERTALLVPPGHTEALAAALERVVVDPTEAAKRAAAARAEIERYTWERRARDVLEFMAL